MALKITLKPKERIIISGAVLANESRTAEFVIENQVPVLREKDIMSEKAADTPCRRIYFVIQLMYIDENNLATHQDTYWKLVRDVLAAAPSTLGLINQISTEIHNGKYYQALKLTQELIEYEKELLNVHKSI